MFKNRSFRYFIGYSIVVLSSIAHSSINPICIILSAIFCGILIGMLCDVDLEIPLLDRICYYILGLFKPKTTLVLNVKYFKWGEVLDYEYGKFIILGVEDDKYESYTTYKVAILE